MTPQWQPGEIKTSTLADGLFHARQLQRTPLPPVLSLHLTRFIGNLENELTARHQAHSATQRLP
jgi:hypothetical protein